MQPEKRRLKAKQKRKTARRIKSNLQKKLGKGHRISSGFNTDEWTKIKEAKTNKVKKQQELAHKKALERKKREPKKG